MKEVIQCCSGPHHSSDLVVKTNYICMLCCNCTDMHCLAHAYARMDTCGRPCSSMSCCGATLTKISRMLRASDRPWQSKQAMRALTCTVVSVVTILEGASSCRGASSMSSSSSSASCPPASHHASSLERQKKNLRISASHLLTSQVLYQAAQGSLERR